MTDVTELLDLYRSPYKNVIKESVTSLLNRLAPPRKNSRRLFVGFGVPYATKDNLDILLMPAHLGACAWPSSSINRALISYEYDWALPDQLFDEIIVIHGLEYSHHSVHLLDECYRCLRSDGQLVVITPNRLSIWAHTDKTPLGFGQPYSMTQLAKILKSRGFMTINSARSLYKLPCISWYGKIFSLGYEFLAKRILQKLSGLVAIAAVKHVYATIDTRKTISLLKPTSAAKVTLSQSHL